MSGEEHSPTNPSDATEAAEAKEAKAPHTADREPTGEEEREAPDSPSPETAAHYQEMAERGARVKGEGELP